MEYNYFMKMTKEKIIISLGVWLIILPFLGFPDSWKTGLIIATGVVVTYLGALVLRSAQSRNAANSVEIKTETFTETS